MSVESVKPRINQNFNGNNSVRVSNKNSYSSVGNNKVAFKGSFKSPNFVVGLMDFIAAGGYAASFCIQDGLGFIAPRVGKGLVRGGKEKKDENGNVVLDKNGQPKRELNWAYARKEGIREIVTGPSAFVIPWLLLKGINKKFGSANSIRLDYIDSFNEKFADFAKNNIDAVKSGKASKSEFYQAVFEDAINSSINNNPKANKLSNDEVKNIAKNYADRQIQIEEVISEKLSKADKKAKLAQIGSIEDDFMALKKSRIGGAVDEMAVELTSSNKGKVGGSIGELTKAMKHYYSDAVSSLKKSLEKDANTNISEVVQKFTQRRMGSRILTNIGLFLTVALFYTQIPKLYNMGLKGNPALEESDSEPALKNNVVTNKNENNKEIAFKGGASEVIGKMGNTVFNNKNLKSLSDIFELNGPIIQGNAMAALLYGFCIPPRLAHAQDKYDYGEIVLRDMTAFSAILFGAKALSRLFSDWFTNKTGLALNKKNLEGRTKFQKIMDYLNPSDSRHAVLSSKQLESKYTNIKNYKDGVVGFIDFIEESGGNIKKALGHDKKIKAVVEKMLGKSYDTATAGEIKSALTNAHISNTSEMKEFYSLFEGANGILNKAKTCNSAFGALSTLVLVPLLIISLTDLCKKMTDKRQAKDKAEKALSTSQAQRAPLILTDKPTMAGFLNKN